MKTKRVGIGIVIIILFIACITFGVACTQRTDTTGQDNSSTTAVNTEEATEESIQVAEETETTEETETDMAGTETATETETEETTEELTPSQQEYADESVESTELKTATEVENLYNGPTEQVPDVMTDEWFRAYSLAGVDESNINKEDVEISDKLADDYELPEDDIISSGISYGNTMLITCMNYINDFVSNRDFESVRISAVSIRADGTCVQMQLDDGYYDFYCLPLDSTKEGCFTVYTVTR